MSPPLVVDASVAVKWLISEDDSALAETLSDRQMLAPSLLLIECASALLRRARAGDVPIGTVAGKVRALRRSPVRLVPVEAHLEAAIALAARLRHALHDCLYLGLALAEGTRLVTADRRFVRAVRTEPNLAGRVVLLAELAH